MSGQISKALIVLGLVTASPLPDAHEITAFTDHGAQYDAPSP